MRGLLFRALSALRARGLAAYLLGVSAFGGLVTAAALSEVGVPPTVVLATALGVAVLCGIVAYLGDRLPPATAGGSGEG